MHSRSMDFREASWLLSGVRFVLFVGALFAMLLFAGRAPAMGAEDAIAQLERARRDTSIDVAAVDRLMIAADSFPPGIVRLEAWMFGAETYARLGRHDLAVPLWKRVASGEEPVLRAAAATALVRHWLARRDLERARDDAGDLPTLVRMVRVAQMRRRLHLASVAVIAVTFVIGTAAVARGRRARSRIPIGAIGAVVAYVAGAGVLAARYERGTARPFLFLALALLPILLLARAWGAAGSRDRRARAMRGALCGASALGAAFVVLEQVDATYLEGLGL